VDTDIFKASTFVFKAEGKFGPVYVILSKIGWSNADTFRQYYDKLIVNTGKYSCAVLKL
jgi:hypothetical protein